MVSGLAGSGMIEHSADAASGRFLEAFDRRNPHQPKLRQAVEGFVHSVMPAYLASRSYREACVLERLTEPDRIIRFRVSWKDDDGGVRINRAWRVQHNNCLGPYKGGRWRTRSSLTA